MLLEVYVIVRGINLYHYSQVDDPDEDIKSNLTSGLLTAIQAFTQEARKSEIEYFASADEYFLFTNLGSSEKMLICVYEKDSDRKMANLMMKQVQDIILQSPIMELASENIVDDKVSEEVNRKINTAIETVFMSNYPVDLAESIFNESNCSYLRIINMEQDEIIFEKARPRPLLKQKQIDELKLMNSSLQKLSEKLEEREYEYITMATDGALFGIIKNHSLFGMSYSSGIVDEKDFHRQTLRIFDFSTNKYSKEKSLIFEMELDQNGDMLAHNGDLPSPMIEIFISSVINSIERYISSFIRKKFSQVEIHFSSNAMMAILADKKLLKIIFYRN